jgi:hypothetical protein
MSKIDYIDCQELVFYDHLPKRNCLFVSIALLEKATILPFDKAKRASSPLQLIHLDICGLINVRA